MKWTNKTKGYLHVIQFWWISVSISLLYQFTTALPPHHVCWTCRMNLWPVWWAEMTSSLTCSAESGVWTVSLQLCTRHAQSSSLFASLPVVKITSLFQLLSTVSFDSAFSRCPKVHRYWAILRHRARRASFLTQKDEKPRSTRRTAQTLYCFNSCYTVKRTKMFLLCQVPGW